MLRSGYEAYDSHKEERPSTKDSHNPRPQTRLNPTASFPLYISATWNEVAVII